jgi:hypothetical protein
MKCVAKSPFANVKRLGLSVTASATHLPKHSAQVHVGDRFAIGSGEDLQALDDEAKTKIAFLLNTSCIVLDTEANKAKIDSIDAQVKAEKTSYEKTVAAASAGLDKLSDSIAAMINAAVAGALKTATAPAK